MVKLLFGSQSLLVYPNMRKPGQQPFANRFILKHPNNLTIQQLNNLITSTAATSSYQPAEKPLLVSMFSIVEIQANPHNS